MVSITVSSATKPPSFARGFPLTIDVSENATVAEVKSAIAKKYPKFKTNRQKITVNGDRKALADETPLKDVLGGLLMDKELQVKDLGAQISWTTVFVIEYIGPLIVHPLLYHFPKLFYGKDVQHSQLQKYLYAMVMLHFIKRELETLFVHRFSKGTMPWQYIIRNSAHYHLLGGVLLALDTYRGKYSATSPFIVNTIRDNDKFLWICVGIWAFAEISNFHTHLTLRALRPEGSRRRAIPYGYGFNLVSLPNYFFEIVGWIVVTVMSASIGSLIFLIFGSVTMAIWAAKKHRNYRKEFSKEYPRNRKAMIPFIF